MNVKILPEKLNALVENIDSINDLINHINKENKGENLKCKVNNNDEKYFKHDESIYVSTTVHTVKCHPNNASLLKNVLFAQHLQI